MTDPGFGSEENYAFLEQHGLGNFVKYNLLPGHPSLSPIGNHTNHQFRAENFGYDKEKDEFICPPNQRLHFAYASHYSTDNGYVTNRRNYECEVCRNCPRKPHCTKAKGNRKIRISFRLLENRRQAKQTSPRWRANAYAQPVLLRWKLSLGA